MTQTFYIAALSTDEKGGIYVYDFDGNKSITQKYFYSLPQCIWLAFSHDHSILYASTQGEGIGKVHSYKVNADKSLTLLNSVDSGANCPCYLGCTPDSKFIYCANYGEDGNACLSEIPLNSDGTLQSVTKIIKHAGKGPNAERQECSHIHCSYVTSDGKNVCAVDLGIDSVKLYRIAGGKGLIESTSDSNSYENTTLKLEDGLGPRHIIFDKNMQYAYVVNELGNSVTSFKHEDGKYQRMQTVSTLPENCKTESYAAAIKFSPKEDALFVSNRGYDSIACFSLDGKGGMTVKNIVPTNGSFPRDISFLPDGKHFTSMNQLGNSITFFIYDEANCNMVPIDLKIDVVGPLCLVF